MYDAHSGKKSIRLWCYTHARKVAASVSKASSTGSKFEQHSEKLSEIDDICTKLSQKHSGKYSVVKISYERWPT